MEFAVYQTPFGFIRMEFQDNTLFRLDRVQGECIDFGQKTAFSEKIFNELDEYFEGKRKNFSAQFQVEGTEFQKKVWQALCDIPYGETRSYKQIAIAIGNEKACRAVGMANNKNPISIIIPCHRVIGADGKLVGYGGGLDMKEILLDLEAKHK